MTNSSTAKIFGRKLWNVNIFKSVISQLVNEMLLMLLVSLFMFLNEEIHLVLVAGVSLQLDCLLLLSIRTNFCLKWKLRVHLNISFKLKQMFKTKIAKTQVESSSSSYLTLHKSLYHSTLTNAFQMPNFDQPSTCHHFE